MPVFPLAFLLMNPFSLPMMTGGVENVLRARLDRSTMSTTRVSAEASLGRASPAAAAATPVPMKVRRLTGMQILLANGGWAYSMGPGGGALSAPHRCGLASRLHD